MDDVVVPNQEIRAFLEFIREKLCIRKEVWLVHTSLEEHGGPGRYAWILRSETEGPPEYIGDLPAHSVATRKVTVDLHLWGDTIEDVEERWRKLRVLFFNEFNTLVSIGQSTWTKPGVMTNGVNKTTPITFSLQVIDDPTLTQTVESIEDDTTGAVPGDGWLELGD